MFTSSLNSFCHSWSTWQVLNSLDLDMVRLLTPMIKNWDADNDVKVIVLKGAGEKVKAPMPPRLAAALGSLLRTLPVPLGFRRLGNSMHFGIC